VRKNLTDTLVVHCIDFRLQAYLDTWLRNELGHGNYDRVSLAGGVFDFDTVLGQIYIAKRLHEINGVILINHEDCGAYGKEGTPERHQADLEIAGRKIKSTFPDLKIERYYLHLDGEFECFSK